MALVGLICSLVWVGLSCLADEADAGGCSLIELLLFPFTYPLYWIGDKIEKKIRK